MDFLVQWRERAQQVRARPLDVHGGVSALLSFWQQDRAMAQLPKDVLSEVWQFCEFVQVPSDQELIVQDECADFMLVLLKGSIGVDHVQEDGARTRLAQAQAGDMLGEMSLLDCGQRSSSCVSLETCHLAVFSAKELDAVLLMYPHLGAALVTMLARKLALRVRLLSQRVSHQVQDSL